MCPGILTHQGPKIGQVFMSPRFLFHLLQIIAEHLNARVCRREVASLYCANALAFPMSGSSMRLLSAVPKSDMIRSIVCHGFGGLEGFLAQQVRR